MASHNKKFSGLSSFWCGLDKKTKKELLQVHKDALVNEVLCYYCRVLLEDATESLQHVTRASRVRCQADDGRSPSITLAQTQKGMFVCSHKERSPTQSPKEGSPVSFGEYHYPFYDLLDPLSQLEQCIRDPSADPSFNIIQLEHAISLKRFQESKQPPQLMGLSMDMIFAMGASMDNQSGDDDGAATTDSSSSSQSNQVNIGGEKKNLHAGEKETSPSCSFNEGFDNSNKDLESFNTFLKELDSQSMELWQEVKADKSFPKQRQLQDVQDIAEDFNLHLLLRCYWSGRHFFSKPSWGKTKQVSCCMYCKDKYRVKFIDSLTYPRPVRSFGLLLAETTTLAEVRTLLITELSQLYREDDGFSAENVVLLSRGRELDTSQSNKTLLELEFKNNQIVIISSTLKKSNIGEKGGKIVVEEEGEEEELKRLKRVERNKKFVGDLLFGGARQNTPSPLLHRIGSLNLSNNATAAAAASAVTSSSLSFSSNVLLKSSPTAANCKSKRATVADVARVDHGLRILKKTLTMLVKRNIYIAYIADVTARENERRLIEQIEADNDRKQSKKKKKKEREKEKKSKLLELKKKKGKPSSAPVIKPLDDSNKAVMSQSDEETVFEDSDSDGADDGREGNSKGGGGVGEGGGGGGGGGGRGAASKDIQIESSIDDLGQGDIKSIASLITKESKKKKKKKSKQSAIVSTTSPISTSDTLTPIETTILHEDVIQSKHVVTYPPEASNMPLWTPPSTGTMEDRPSKPCHSIVMQSIGPQENPKNVFNKVTQHEAQLAISAQSSFPKFCHECGSSLVANSKFCSQCGTMVVKLPQSSPPPPPPLSTQPSYPANSFLDKDVNISSPHLSASKDDMVFENIPSTEQVSQLDESLFTAFSSSFFASSTQDDTSELNWNSSSLSVDIEDDSMLGSSNPETSVSSSSLGNSAWCKALQAASIQLPAPPPTMPPHRSAEVARGEENGEDFGTARLPFFQFLHGPPPGF